MRYGVDWEGQNILFYAMKSRMEDVVLKYIDDETLSAAQDSQGLTVGMYAASVGAKKVVDKVLDNNRLAIQQDRTGRNIGMYCVSKNYEDLVIKALSNETLATQTTVFYNVNIGMLAAKNKMKKAVFVALDNPVAALQTDIYGYNIGMYAAENGLEKETLKAMDNKQAITQRSKDTDSNMAMLAAKSGLEEPVLKALENLKNETCEKSMPDYEIFNLVYFATENNMERVALKAFEIPEIYMDDAGLIYYVIDACKSNIKNCGKPCFVDSILKALDNPDIVEKFEDFIDRVEDLGVHKINLKITELKEKNNNSVIVFDEKIVEETKDISFENDIESEMVE